MMVGLTQSDIKTMATVFNIVKFSAGEVVIQSDELSSFYGL